MAERGRLTVRDLQAQQFANRVPAGDLIAADAAKARCRSPRPTRWARPTRSTRTRPPSPRPPRTPVAELRATGIPLNSPLGEHQFVVRNGKRIPVPGGTESLGVWNKVEPVRDPANGGYTDVTTGSSHIQAVGRDGGRCPVARTLLTYSQSSNPNSPHFSDQTRLLSAEKWVTSRFCEKDVLASPALRIVRVRS